MKGGIDRYSIVQFYRQMATLIRSGFGFTRAIGVCIRQSANPTLKKNLGKVKDALLSGYSLSEAMEVGGFSTFHIQMLKAAEISGTLPEVLERIALYEEKELVLVNRLKGAMVYPVFVFVISFLTIILIMSFLSPLLNTITDVLGGNIPLPTRILIRFIDSIKNPFTYVALSLTGVVLFVTYTYYSSTPTGRFSIDRLKFNIPLWGKLYKKVLIIRFCRVMHQLLSAGVPIVKTMELLGDVSGNFYFKEMVTDPITFRIKEGMSIEKAFEGTKFFPKVMLSMLRIGETSGALPKSLDRLSTIYEFDVDMSIDIFYATLEPILICLLGGITFLIMMAAFLPLYQIIGRLNL